MPKNISISFKLFFKMKYVCRFPKGLRKEQALTIFAVKYCLMILVYEVDFYFATEADTMKGIVYDFKPSSKDVFLLTVPRRHFFCGSFLLFVFRVCHLFLSARCSLVVTCWEMADLLALLCVMFY